MTTQRNSSKHVLFLGLDHDFAEQLAVWLTATGLQLVALGGESDRQIRVKREAATYGKTFDYLSANLSHSKTLETCLESLIYQFDGVDCVINVLDNRLLRQPGCCSGLSLPVAEQPLIKIYQTLCRQYPGIGSLTRIVNIVFVPEGPSVSVPVAQENDIAQDHVFIVEPSSAVGGERLPLPQRSRIPLEWVGRAVLNRLSTAQGSATQWIEVIGNEGFFHDWGTDRPTSRKLGKILPPFTAENIGKRPVPRNPISIKRNL